MALPAPTPLASSNRYFVAGTRKYTWVPTIASKAAPTLAELSAGTDLSGEVMTVNGFNIASEKFATPDAGSRFTSSIPGRLTSDDSSIVFHASSNGTDVRGTLTRDLNGFVVIYNEGIVTGGKCDVFPARVSSVSKQQDIEADGQIEVAFAITSVPALDLAIPTA